MPLGLRRWWEPANGNCVILNALRIVIDLPVSGFNLLKSRNGITIYGATPQSRPRIWICLLRSLSTLAMLAIQILYPPSRSARRRIPSPCSSRYSFTALALTSPALPDSPALRLQPYIGIRFLLTIGVYHELVNSNRSMLYENQAKSRPQILVCYAH